MKFRKVAYFAAQMRVSYVAVHKNGLLHIPTTTTGHYQQF